MMEKQVTLNNTAGLHARPATLFVQAANQFKETTVKLVTADKTVDAKSVLSMMTLEAKQGTTLTIRADGPQEAEMLAALVTLIESNFGEH